MSHWATNDTPLNQILRATIAVLILMFYFLIFSPAMAQFANAAMKISIEEQKSFAGQSFPLVLAPNSEQSGRNMDFWLNWTKENKALIKEELLKYGAVLFRGFPIQNAEDFDAFVKIFGYKAFPYVGGAAPRTVVTGDVFTANEAPPSEKIPYHHEMAQQ
jgi:hypothetical protein